VEWTAGIVDAVNPFAAFLKALSLIRPLPESAPYIGEGMDGKAALKNNLIFP
jgi:hypothetical protein